MTPNPDAQAADEAVQPDAQTAADPELPSLDAPTGVLDAAMCADFLLEGLDTAEIAAKTGLDLDFVTKLAASPKVAYLIQRTQTARQGPFDIETELARELPATFDKILELRDTAADESIQFRAAVELFDRQRPKITKNESELTVRISIDADQAQLATDIAAEVEALDAEYALIDDTATTKEPAESP